MEATKTQDTVKKATEQSFMECLQEIHDREENEKAATGDSFVDAIDQYFKELSKANHAAMLAAQAEAQAQEKARQANEAQLALVRAEAKKGKQERRELEREAEWNFLKGLNCGMLFIVGVVVLALLTAILVVG